MPRRPPEDDEVVRGLVICEFCGKGLQRIEWAGRGLIAGKHLTFVEAEECRLLRKFTHKVTKGARL